ncbi:MAG TPA: T9SS type A sorting domain-containing protein, partial [Bacteroidia bacterium]|nr:T9SS type A sorting domain-containing protein [Bacteroidia bacterium]
GSNRPGEWFWSLGFASVDSTDGVLMSNSWTNMPSTPVDNILVTPRLQIVDGNAQLSWRSAVRQTPHYLDGYMVLVSTSNNDPSSFTDTIFRASEYVSQDNAAFPYDFSSYTFDPAPTANPLSPFVHGMDGTYTVNEGNDSERLVGVLRPFTVSLAAYSGMTIYVEFDHYSHDDNLLCIDDILVTGTNPSSVAENNSGVTVGAYPNPANDQLTVNLGLKAATNVTVAMYDLSGQLVSTQDFGMQQEGQHRLDMNTAGLAAGMYIMEVQTSTGKTTARVAIQH